MQFIVLTLIVEKTAWTRRQAKKVWRRPIRLLVSAALLLSFAVWLGCGGAPPAAAPSDSLPSSLAPSSSLPSADVSAEPDGVQTIASQTARTTAADRAEKLFTRLEPAETGIDFTIRWDKPAEFDRVFYSQNTGGGVCVADYDQDGLPDIYLTRTSGGNRLYRNLGNFHFDDVTERAGLRDDAFWGTGASFVDIDNDGDLDLYACSYAGANRLYVNQGDGSFRLEPSAFGLDFLGASVTMAFADYDRDGDLDGYLVTAGLPPGDKKFRVKFVDGRPIVRDELQEYWELLYLPGDKAKQIEAGQVGGHRRHGYRTVGDLVGL